MFLVAEPVQGQASTTQQF